ncbi:MAG: SDR family oxidoreductase [Myxococcales bacterium]|nr:SDR family oxidoreductase [Myxococcales bacterium]
MLLRGKTAVITGGGRGIGSAVAHALSRAGARLLVAARSRDQVERVAAELTRDGFEAHATTCDVTQEDSVEALLAHASQKLGPVDILINNAGIASSAPIKATTLDDWNRVLAVNATGPFLCTRAFIAGMAERRWGRVVNVASITSRMGAPYVGAYTASKHAVLGFTRVAAAEYADKGVTINAVCPGYVDTEMTQASVDRVVDKTQLDRDGALAAILKTANQKRLIRPDEVAFVVASLCAEQAGGINGQAIVIDGGGLLS